MEERPVTHLPARLEAVRRRFEKWRLGRNGHERIPEALWAAAVRAAAQHGVYPTVRVLGLDYNSLKRRVAATAMRSESGAGTPRFVELVGPAAPPPAECVLEVENRSGARLRIHLRGAAVPDVAELARCFAQVEP
jgi:hypothetical protein